MKKIIVIFFFLLFCTGCDINYEVFYKNNNEIYEELDFSIYNDDALLYNDTVDNYIYDSFYAKKNAYDLRNYDLVIEENESVSNVSLSKKHESLESLVNNKFFDAMFSSKDIYESNGKVIVEFSGYKYGVDVDSEIFMDSEETDNLYITIRSNYKLETNADEVNNFVGVYKWNFDSNSKNKTIKVKFLDEINYFAYICNLNPILLALVCIVLFAIIVYLFYYFYRKKIHKVNKL